MPSDNYMPLRVRVENFETLNDPLLYAMKTAAEQFCLHLWRYSRDGGLSPWLIFLGNSGIGKTYLARKIFNHWKIRIASAAPKPGENFGGNKLHSGIFCDCRNTMRRIRAGASAGISISENVAEIIESGLIVLDDVGVGIEGDSAAKQFTLDITEQVLAGRCGKPTVITSNLMLDQIKAQLDPRIASRMIRNGSDAFLIQGTTADFNERQKH